MPFTIEKKLVVAVASSALFDLRESQAVFDQQGESAYRTFQRAKECPYDLNPCDWFKSYVDESKTLQQIDATKQHDQKTTSFWCSALISFVLVVAGFLDKSVPWTVITPYDFSSYCKPQRLAFQGCAYDVDTMLC